MIAACTTTDTKNVKLDDVSKGPREEAKDDGFSNPEIEHLFEPMGELISRMRRSIQKGEYKLLIGDDASGRVPTFIFTQFLKSVYEKNNMKGPATAFLAGARGLEGEEAATKSAEIEEFLNERYTEDLSLMRRHGGMVLVVTDTIVTGKSLQPIADALSRLGITFEIASVAGAKDERDDLQRKLGGRIFFGGQGIPGIYDPNEHDLHGVWKDAHELFAHALKKEAPDRRAVEIQKKIQSAREDANKLVKELLERYGQHM